MKLTGGDFINLKDFKISIVDENGKLKDFQQILKELAEKWSEGGVCTVGEGVAPLT